MPDNLENGLRDLAEHGRRTGRLDPAATVRQRADRRRKNRRTIAGALGVVLVVALGAGLAIGRQGSPPAPPATSASPSVTPVDLLDGRHQVLFALIDQGKPVGKSVLGVAASGKLGVTTDQGDRALFVPVPAGKDLFQIKTGKITSGGAARCLGVKNNGSQSLTVTAVACDPADTAQLFSIFEHGKDSQGRISYAIENRSAFVQWFPNGSGLIAEEMGDATLDTTFVLVNRGPSTVS